MPGTRRYYVADLKPCCQFVGGHARGSEQNCCIFHDTNPHGSTGWNVFLGRNNTRRNRSESPVYSLSKPSGYSPTFFAGIEDQVLEFDMVSIMDKFPDPIYGQMPSTGRWQDDIRLKWASKKPILRLSMYVHPSSTHEGARLREQRAVGYYEGIYPGWDERWAPV